MEDLKKIFEQVVLKGSFVGTHDDLAALEKRVAEYCGTAEAIALNSGTDALLLAMLVSGIGKGDEVITPPNSFVASTADHRAARRHAGLRRRAGRPEHRSREDRQGDHAPDQGDHAGASHRPHLPRWTRSWRSPNRHGLVVIEDAAQAIGSMYKGRLSGLDRPLRLLLGASAQEPECAGRRRLRHHQRQGGGRAHAPPARARHGRPRRPSRNGAWSRAWIRCRRRSSATASTSCPT